ncbi:MAG: DUF4363 family protein [Oscillospiraceae bacterium]|nr:DUF4363 family protein [Oscillospiraceae bacterium]
MKKALLAGLLLAMMLGASFWNIRHLDVFTDELEKLVLCSMEEAGNGDGQKARETLQTALERWNGSETYIQVFIRHSEADAVSDGFYDVFYALDNGDENVDAAYEKLLFHIRGIDSMEHITLKSVF